MNKKNYFFVYQKETNTYSFWEWAYIQQLWIVDEIVHILLTDKEAEIVLELINKWNKNVCYELFMMLKEGWFLSN